MDKSKLRAFLRCLIIAIGIEMGYSGFDVRLLALAIASALIDHFLSS